MNGVYRVYLNLDGDADGRNLLGPSQDIVAATTQLYAWYQDNNNFTQRMYTFEKQEDGTYLWLCRNDPNLAVGSDNGIRKSVA